MGVRRQVPGRQDRRPRQHADAGHAHLRAPLHHPRRPRSREHRRGQATSPASSAIPTRRRSFFWNVIAPSWNNVDPSGCGSRATLPAEVTGAECSVGVGRGAVLRRADGVRQHGRAQLRRIWHPAPRSRCGPASTCRPRRESACRGPSNGTASSAARWAASSGWLALSVAGAVGAYLWYRTTVEPNPGFPVQYAPPPGLGPVQTEYIRTEAVPKNGLTATLFYLAERKLIDLEQVNDKQWNVRGTAEARRVGGRRPRQHRRRVRAQGDGTRQGVRGQEDGRGGQASSPPRRPTWPRPSRSGRSTRV